MASRYTHESPMEFEFQNGTGPLDARSPFANVKSNARFPEAMSCSPRKRTYDASFDSPSKNRTMGNQQSSPRKGAAFNALFTTPRKSQNEIDDSSAGETPKSPEPRDSVDATPEAINTRSALTRFDSASAPTLPGAEREHKSPTKQRLESQRRDSFLIAGMVKLKNKMYSPSSGRGEIVRKDHSGAIEKAARKKKRDVDRRVARKRRHSMSDSGEDHGQPPKSPRKRSGQHSGLGDDKPHWVSSLFNFIAERPSLPQTLSYYAQFIFNVFLLLCCGYLIYCFWSAVQGDVDKKSHEATVDVMAEMALCAKEYQNNKCAPETRIPHMENVCANWEKCMNQDPRKVGRAKVSAHTFAEIFNSFVEPISYKAMLFTAILVFGCFGISNFAFGFFRNRAQQPTYGYGYGYGAPPPPPTPQRSFSGQDAAFYAGTPWHQVPSGMGFEPQPSVGYGQIEGQGSPVRRLVYN